MRLELLTAAAIWLCLLVYALSGGADFGGGVWDLCAFGPRAARQRSAVAEAIAPIWEANHVWLIIVIVLLFTGFPLVFAAAATALHVPLTLMLVGIVLRGSAFVFRAYSRPKDAVYRRWGLVFSAASVLTPLMLGACVGAAASGRIRVEAGVVTSGFWRPWLAAFPLCLGLFTVSLFSYLAAVYLIFEAKDRDLKEDFRSRALAAGAAAGVLAWVCFALAKDGAPQIFAGLSARAWSLPFQLLTGAVAACALAALYFRAYGWARVLAVSQVGLVLVGWPLAQYPFLIVPDLTVRETSAAASVLVPVLLTLAGGALLILPAFAWLYSIFKERVLE